MSWAIDYLILGEKSEGFWDIPNIVDESMW